MRAKVLTSAGVLMAVAMTLAMLFYPSPSKAGPPDPQSASLFVNQTMFYPYGTTQLNSINQQWTLSVGPNNLLVRQNSCDPNSPVGCGGLVTWQTGPYCPNGNPCENATYVILQDDGNLVLRSGYTDQALWNAGTFARTSPVRLPAGNRATIQDDGNFVVYHQYTPSAQRTPCAVWSSSYGTRTTPCPSA